jgi:hypothetical protein
MSCLFFPLYHLWSGGSAFHRTRVINGDRSLEIKVSGFTVEYTSSTRIFGVAVTFDDGTTVFGSSYASHESKILVTVNPSTAWRSMSFSEGHW